MAVLITNYYHVIIPTFDIQKHCQTTRTLVIMCNGACIGSFIMFIQVSYSQSSTAVNVVLSTIIFYKYIYTVYIIIFKSKSTSKSTKWWPFYTIQLYIVNTISHTNRDPCLFFFFFLTHYIYLYLYIGYIRGGFVYN